MIKRKRPKSPSRDDDTVGYGKPPVQSRFRPGESGNPAGRRKGVRNLRTDVVRALAAPVRVTEKGRTRTRSTQEGALMLLREKALRGDARALDRMLELAARFNNDIVEVDATKPLSADDYEILQAFIAESTASTQDHAVPTGSSQADRKPVV